MSRIIKVPSEMFEITIPIEDITSYEKTDAGVSIYIKGKGLEGDKIIQATCSYEDFIATLTKIKLT